MSAMFDERLELLQEFCQLPRQSLCFEVITILSYYYKNVDNVEYQSVQDENGNVFYSWASLKEHMSPKSLNNFSKALPPLADAGYLERLVLGKHGNVVTDNKFSRSVSNVYWRMTDKAIAMLALEGEGA